MMFKSSAKPKRIGVTQRVDAVAGRDERRDALDQRWTSLLQSMGAVAIPLANEAAHAEGYLNDFGLDGVIFSGGNDPMDAPGAVGTAPERDALERALLTLCMERDLPVLGVCRGAQMLNLLLGGRLARVEKHVAVRHPVELKADFLKWPERFEVNSFHSFGIREADLAPGLVPIADVVTDGTIEAFCLKDKPVVGIFWHPEREDELKDWDRQLFKALFALGR